MPTRQLGVLQASNFTSPGQSSQLDEAANVAAASVAHIIVDTIFKLHSSVSAPANPAPISKGKKAQPAAHLLAAVA